MQNILLFGKGQLVLKANCQTNKFVFTTMRQVFVHFFEEIEDTKKTFRNELTFIITQTTKRLERSSFV